MARTKIELKTVRNPVTRVRATEIKAKLDDHDDVLDAIEALADGGLVGEYLGAPTLADTDYFVVSTVMKATAYTLAQTTLPANNPPRNVSVKHTTDTTTDTLGSAVVVGTDGEDNAISETIALSADSTVYGAKAFKTIASVTTAGWVIGGGVADLIEVGFGPKLGLSRRMTATSQLFMATLAGVALLPVAIAANATAISGNTVDLSSGTYNGIKVARAMLNFDGV